MSVKIHLQEPDHLRATCGRKASKMATDPGQVTCKHCIEEIELLLETPEEQARRRAGPRAKAIARGRAMATLRDRYPEEYQREAAKALYEVYPPIYEEELAFILEWQARNDR